MATRWLFKTEPSVYSYQQLVKDKKTMWDGVKNNLALKNLKDIKKGDEIFIYHTGDERAAVGIARALGGIGRRAEIIRHRRSHTGESKSGTRRAHRPHNGLWLGREGIPGVWQVRKDLAADLRFEIGVNETQIVKDL